MPVDFLFWENVVLPLAGIGAALTVVLTVIRTVSRHFDRRHEARMGASAAGRQPDDVRSELKDLRAHVDALEERLDFTERLLTQERARRQLEGGA